jgi:EF hand
MSQLSLRGYLAAACVVLAAVGCGDKNKDKDKRISAVASSGADEREATPSASGEKPALPALPRRRLRMRGEPANAGSEPDDRVAESDEASRERRQERRDQRRAVMEEHRAKFDKNGDGTIDDDERAAMRKERSARMVSEVDSDADGKLTREEVQSAPPGIQRLLENFDEVDTDGDSQISSEEFEAATANRRMDWRNHRGRRVRRGSEREAGQPTHE